MGVPDGGPAFPTSAINVPFEEAFDPKYLGMTLRDWFAGQALAGHLASATLNSAAYETHAEMAYQLADAMLAERKAEAS